MLYIFVPDGATVVTKNFILRSLRIKLVKIKYRKPKRRKREKRNGLSQVHGEQKGKRERKERRDRRKLSLELHVEVLTKKAKSCMNLKEKRKGLPDAVAKSKIYQMGWKKRKGKQSEKRNMNLSLKDLTKTGKRVMNLKEKGKEKVEVLAKSGIYQMGWKKRKEKRKGKKRKMNKGLKHLTKTAKRVMNLK